jgi:hypothetical protein
MSPISLSVCPWQAFLASLMIVGRLLALPKNIRLEAGKAWRDKPFSLLETTINNGRKKSYNIRTRS